MIAHFIHFSLLGFGFVMSILLLIAIAKATPPGIKASFQQTEMNFKDLSCRIIPCLSFGVQ